MATHLTMRRAGDRVPLSEKWGLNFLSAAGSLFRPGWYLPQQPMRTQRFAALGLALLLAPFLLGAGPGAPKEGTGADGPDGPASFSFVVWGHPRDGDGEPPVHFKEILQRIRDLGADFVIVTGDCINGMYAKPKDPAVLNGDWDRFETGIKQLGIPFYIAPGNHDVNDPVTRDLFLERFRKPPYAFTFKGSRFIILDTVGIDRQTRGPTRYQPGRSNTWYAGAIPFDNYQMNFLREEAAQADAYEHVFLFFHHSEVWLESSSDWWTEVHPLLSGGPTRAVFSGNPWKGKYRYVERDGIYYIESATFPMPSVSGLRRQPERARDSKLNQLDNLQFVRVQGSDYSIQTIVVGALSTPSLSQTYWDQVEEGRSRREKLLVWFNKRFNSYESLILLAVVGGGACLLAGAVLGVGVSRLWRRGRRRSATASHRE